MNESSCITNLYREYCLDIEEELIKGLHAEEHHEWKCRFLHAVPRDLDEFELEDYFKRVRWELSIFVLKETISPLSVYKSNDDIRRRTLDVLDESIKLFNQAIKNKYWDRSEVYPVGSSLQEVLPDTLDGFIVSHEHWSEYNALKLAECLLQDDNLKESIASTIMWSTIRTAEQVSKIKKENKSLLSSIFSQDKMSKSEKAERVSAIDKTCIEEHLKYSRKFLTLLHESH